MLISPNLFFRSAYFPLPPCLTIVVSNHTMLRSITTLTHCVGVVQGRAPSTYFLPLIVCVSHFCMISHSVWPGGSIDAHTQSNARSLLSRLEARNHGIHGEYETVRAREIACKMKRRAHGVKSQRPLHLNAFLPRSHSANWRFLTVSGQVDQLRSTGYGIPAGNWCREGERVWGNGERQKRLSREIGTVWLRSISLSTPSHLPISSPLLLPISNCKREELMKEEEEQGEGEKSNDEPSRCIDWCTVTVTYRNQVHFALSPGIQARECLENREYLMYVWIIVLGMHKSCMWFTSCKSLLSRSRLSLVCSYFSFVHLWSGLSQNHMISPLFVFPSLLLRIIRFLRCSHSFWTIECVERERRVSLYHHHSRLRLSTLHDLSPVREYERAGEMERGRVAVNPIYGYQGEISRRKRSKHRTYDEFGVDFDGATNIRGMGVFWIRENFSQNL